MKELEEFYEYMKANDYFIGNDLEQKYNELSARGSNIGKEFSKTKYNVMTVTSRNGSITKTYKIEEFTSESVYKCRVIKDESWHYPGSSWDGSAKYNSNKFEYFLEDEILNLLK